MNFLVFLGIFAVCNASKVFDWKRDWLSTVTMEMAQIQDGDKQIIHSSLGSTFDQSVASISMHDFQHTSRGFKKGIVAIRPVLSDGSQVCFVMPESKRWGAAVNMLKHRHKSMVAVDRPVTYVLQARLPGKLDPLSVPSLAEFCDVSRRYIFYMKPVYDISTVSIKIMIQGLFSRLHVGIPDEYVDRIIETGRTDLDQWTLIKISSVCQCLYGQRHVKRDLRHFIKKCKF